MLCWEGAAPWCSEHLAGRCFFLLFGFSWLNPNFSPQFLAPGGSLDLQGGGRCSKSITTVGWAGRSQGAQARVGEGKGDWLLLVFIPVTAPGMNHQARKT